MKICIINILFCFLLLPAMAADNYALNDTLYVWARNGLNLREQPDLKGKVIKTLESGTRVIVREMTEKKLTLNSGVDTTEFTKEPYLLKGEWILVEIDSGRKGYLFDVYLLKFPTPRLTDYVPDDYLVYQWKSGLSIDTTWDDEFKKAGEIKYQAQEGIRFTRSIAREYGALIMEVDEFSIEDVFIFYMFFHPDGNIFSNFDNPVLDKNWADELNISIEICTIRFYLKGKTLFIEENCSC